MTQNASSELPAKLPFSPSWLTPRRAMVWSVALGAAAMTDPALRLVRLVEGKNLIHGVGLEWLVVCSTAWLSVAVARRALSTDSVAGAGARAVMGGIFAGALNAGIALALLTMALGSLGEVLAAFVLGTVFGGLVYGGPLGFMYGLAFAPVVMSTAKAERAPSHESLNRVLLACGAWLSVVGALSAQLARGPFVALGWAALVLGIEFLIAAIYRDVCLARWLQRVEAGFEPGWKVVARQPADDFAATGAAELGGTPNGPLIPLVDCGPWELYEGVLTSYAATSDGPYRLAEHEIAHALVPKDLGRAAAVVRRWAASGALMLAMVVVALVPWLLLAQRCS